MGQFQWTLLRNTCKDIYIDGFHSDVIKLQSQKARFYEFVFTLG